MKQVFKGANNQKDKLSATRRAYIETIINGLSGTLFERNFGPVFQNEEGADLIWNDPDHAAHLGATRDFGALINTYLQHYVPNSESLTPVERLTLKEGIKQLHNTLVASQNDPECSDNVAAPKLH
jgi:hypothetical protein